MDIEDGIILFLLGWLALMLTFISIDVHTIAFTMKFEYLWRIKDE